MCTLGRRAAGRSWPGPQVHYGRASLSALSRLPAYFVFGRSGADPAALAARLAAHAGSLGAERALLVLLDQPLLWAAAELRRQLAIQAAPRLESAAAAEPPAGQACLAAEHPGPGGELGGGAAPRLHAAEQAPAFTEGAATGGRAADWQPGPGARAAAQPAAGPAGRPAIVVADAAARHLDPGEDAAGAARLAAGTSGRICAAGYAWQLPAGVQASCNMGESAVSVRTNQCAEADSLMARSQHGCMELPAL